MMKDLIRKVLREMVTKTEVIALKHKNEIPVINVLTDEVSLFFKSIYAAR